MASAKEVELFHRQADTDGRKESLHHTLGPNPAQASPGDHRHDGSDSLKILTGITITGSRDGSPILLSIIQALESLGATDNSSP